MTLKSITFVGTLLVGLSPPAWAFNINLYNNETLTPLLVQVWDENTPDEKRVFNGSLDSGAGPVPVELTSVDGKGHVKWDAKSADRTKCGSGEVTDLDTGADVKLTTPDGC